MPFHYNISARAKAGRLFGIKIKDPVQQRVRAVEFLAACMALANEKFSRSVAGQRVIRALPRPILKLALYFMKALESVYMPNTKHIAIIGGTIWGNRGAEAMLATTIGASGRHFRLQSSRSLAITQSRSRTCPGR